MEPSQCQSGFRDGERRTDHIETVQLLVSGDDFHGSQVDGAQYDMVCFRRLQVDLQRGLSVQGDGNVDDIPPFAQAIGRRVCPPTGQIDTHRTAPPYNLVGIDRQLSLIHI